VGWTKHAIVLRAALLFADWELHDATN
jgi:hypothetical protein